MLVIILTGCLGPSPEESVYNVLEKVAKQEQLFEDQQQPLVDLEKKEGKLYDEIISLGMKEHDQIVAKSKEAITIVEQREQLIAKEHESMEASKKEFKNLEKEIEAIKESDAKKLAQDINKVMKERYDSYDRIYENYEKAVTYDKELYTMLQNKDLKIEDLEAQIAKNNDLYKKVLSENNEFNNLTKQYNELKLKFYKKANIEVEEKKE